VKLRSLSVLVHSCDSGELAAAASTCEFLVSLLGTSGQHDVCIGYEEHSNCSLAVTGPTLARLFEQSRNNLWRVTFVRIDRNKELIRALATGL
jgi:hypothetical protein